MNNPIDIDKNIERGTKECINCRRVFKGDGYPVSESWMCSKYCHDTHRLNPLNSIIMDDTILSPTRYASDEYKSIESVLDELKDEDLLISMAELHNFDRLKQIRDLEEEESK